ncbi:hypothetical protein SAMN05421640_1055 [Ekhidna lutea]|uniref:Outer membrane protein beta-barrel domain-containing protein n=1 Tax=Ekhidna lutea TaxID=447679 RepID=A0A239GXJ6_EKHLU|nr:hypothetical protein [Ekhidna lutea]SNS73880.1 hypothetical protein SAMN05421640_1055 [Ekhidna lutea]
MLAAFKRYGLHLVLSLISCVSIAQDIYEKYDIYRNPAMVFLNKFSITATTGLAITNYSHKLEGVYFYQEAENQFIFSNGIENLGSSFSGYTDWLNDPQPGFETSLENPFDVPFDYLENPVYNPALGDQTFLINTDTTDFGFKGASRGIPITLSIHYNFDGFRIGGGYSYEFHFLRSLEPTAFGDQVRNYVPNTVRTRYSRLFGLVGYRFYQFWSYDFVAELQVGKVTAGSQFNSGAISRGLYTNIGVSIENNWSEYFRVIIRPSVDFKSYTVNLPDGAAVSHKYPTFSIQAGISINIPDIPRSPMKSDHVQLKHVYRHPVTGQKMEVRGQPIHKRQNPKVGENHRKLWRYKRKNKRKLNPTKN